MRLARLGIREGSLTGNAALAFLENVITLAAKMTAILVFSWSLGPEAQGEFTLFLVVHAMATTAAGLGLDISNNYWASRLRRRAVLAALVGNTLALGAVLSLLSVGAVAGLRWWTDLIDSVSEDILPVLLAAIFLGGLALPLGGLTYGVNRFRDRAFGTVLHYAIFLIGLAVLAAWPALSVASAMAVWTYGLAACVLFWLLRLLRQTGGRLAVWPSLAARQVRYGLRSYVYFLMSIANFRLDALIIAYFLGVGPLGVYSVAVAATEALLYIPKSLVNAVLTRTATTGAQIGDIVRHLSAVLLILVVASGFVLPVVLRLAFSEHFAASGMLALLLLPGTYATGMATVGAYYLFGKGRAWDPSLAAAAGAVTTVAANLALIPPFGIVGAAIASSLAYGVFLVVVIGYLSQCENTPVSSLIRPSFNRLTTLLGRTGV